MNSGASLSGWPPYAVQPQQQIDDGPTSPSLLKPSSREAARAISANQHPTDSPGYFDSKLALVDSASSTHGRHFTGSAVDDSSEQMEPMDLAALGRLLPDLDDGDQPSLAGQAPVPANAAAAAAAGINIAGRPLRGRVGSTASVEEDIFSSVGGLELGHDPNDPAGSAAAAEQLLSGSGSLGIPSVASLADLAPVDTPSRTLFVQNVASGVPDDEIRRLFAAHGDLRTLYTACKQRGLVIVGYFDLRSAISAARQLSGYNLGGRALEVAFSAPKKGETNQVNQGVVVVYNLDPDTTNDQLVWIFSRFGEVKDIQQSPTRTNQKFIEFFDVRHAAAALRAMNKAELSRLPAAVPNAHPGGASSSSLAAMLGAEHDAAAGGRHRVLSGDGSAARHGDAAGASSSQHALAAAQVAAAMRQLELEQQQQQQSFQCSQGQPIPQPQGYEQQMAMAMQQDNLQQQVAQRGMVRPVSGMLDRLHTAVSPPLNLGPLSQSWDTSGNPGSLSGLLNRQQQQQPGQQQHAQQPGQQQQSQQALLQQQQQQFLLQQLASGFFNRGSRTDLSGLDPVLETDNGNDDLQKLLMGTGVTAAAGGVGSSAGPGTAHPARPPPMGNSSMHVSDSASSIASAQGNVFGAGAGLLTGGHALHHGPFGPRAPGMPGPSGTPAFGVQQPLGPNAAATAAAAAAAAAGNANALQRSFGSSDQLHGMEQLISQQAAAAAAAGQDEPGSAGALGMLGNSLSANNLAAAAAAAGLSANAAANLGLGGAGLGNGMASASFDSGLNLVGEGQHHAGLSGLLGSHPYLLSAAGDAAAAGGFYRGAGAAAGSGGMRSLSHPCLSMSAMAAMAAQQAQQQQQHQQQQNAAAAAAAAVAAGRLLNQQNAAAAAAMLQAQAAGLNLQDLQQQQQQQMALQQLLQANLHAQTLAGAANLHAAQQLLQAGMHPQQLAAAGLLNPASLASLGLPGSSSYGSLHNLGALQLQSAAAAAASAAAAAAVGSSGIPRGASTGSLSGLTDGRGHRGGEGGASSSGGSRGGGRLSRRAADPAVEAERKAQQEKLFALDVDRILSGEDKRTTLMIKNIPNKYTQKMLLQTIEEQFKGTFDFFYLPIDFKNKCNVGYAFINMLSPQYIPPLVARFNNKRWDKFNSEKVCNISYGRIQGRAALISHFQNSSLMHEDKRCRPVLFISEGPDAGEPEPFPMGVHARPRVAGSSGGGGSSGHLSSERSPRVSSSGAMSGGSAAGGSLAGSRANSSTALASAAAAASQPGSEQGLGRSSSHGGSGGGLAGAGGGELAGGTDAAARGSSSMHAPPGL